VPQPWPDLTLLEKNQLLSKANIFGDLGLENGFASDQQGSESLEKPLRYSYLYCT